MVIMGVIYLIYKFIVFKENIIWEALKPYCKELEYSVLYMVLYTACLQIYIFFDIRFFFIMSYPYGFRFYS